MMDMAEALLERDAYAVEGDRERQAVATLLAQWTRLADEDSLQNYTDVTPDADPEALEARIHGIVRGISEQSGVRVDGNPTFDAIINGGR